MSEELLPLPAHLLPDPDGIHTERELIAGLRMLKNRTGLTYRQLESRARRAGHHLPRSTIASVLARTTLPREEFVTTLVQACRLDPEPWRKAYCRVAHRDTAPGSGSGDPAARPWQMPYCPPDLVGHEEELRSVANWLTAPYAPSPVTVITGPPGVGKSVLALRAIRRAAAHYPDGQLYVELRGATPEAEPLPVERIVGRLLRGLGIPAAQLPADASERMALLRTVLSDRKVLVVLDGAASAGQVRSLIPAHGHSAVLITSRSGLVSLDGSRLVRLRPLPPPEAEAVLRRLLDGERATPGPETLRKLASYCGGLPLALRVAAARLNARTDLSAGEFVRQLADERHRLSALRVDDLEVRASLAASYQTLARVDDADRTLTRAFLLFGQPGMSKVRPTTVAESLRIPRARAEWAVELLLDGHLIESTPSGHYRMYDVLRCFAREQARTELAGGAVRTGRPRGLPGGTREGRRIAEEVSGFPVTPWAAAFAVQGASGAPDRGDA
ncbi:NB-ARC domain-containing protein [Streptomyces megasporus]|uniref:NB-ARC domain-containing protein n=1 Tax=Streptomyces megasporus TaxID=44060 RepID=UPI0004E17A7F|nr:NB-ARC domain-containing protein [Streptomyces megasporus]